MLVSSPLFGALVLVFCSACDTGGRRSRQAATRTRRQPGRTERTIREAGDDQDNARRPSAKATV